MHAHDNPLDYLAGPGPANTAEKHLRRVAESD